jgi:WD40 repeat protein
MNISLPSHLSRPSDMDSPVSPSIQPPRYTMDSPVSPGTYSPFSLRTHSRGSAVDYPISPLHESLNVPIPMAVGSRLSVDLPIPVRTPAATESAAEGTSLSEPLEMPSGRLHAPSIDSMRSGGSIAKMKSPSRTFRITSSIRRKPTTKERDAFPLPKEPSFIFSSAGHSLLLWGKGTDHLVRFDIPSNDASAIQGCRYEVVGIEAVAAGNHKCAVIAAKGLSKRKLFIFDGNNLTPEYETDLDFSGRLSEISIAVSRNDKYVATSLNDHMQLFNLEDGIKPIAFHHQIHVYELRGGISHKRTVSVARTTSDDDLANSDDNQKMESGWFGTHMKGLSNKEKAEEQQRQTAIISRKIYFSTDSKRLAVATQLGDHCVYVDVWDCTREPVSTISEHSRSFKMPPWTLNDGDLTGVFYDSMRRCALVTAFLGKEYPVLIPFPGYDHLQNETYSTKIVHTAQSPSGLTFVSVNAMTELIQFEYTARGTLSPRKLKKASGKISTSVFKPGAIALAMPLENVLQIFWVKDGKCMLRSVKIGSGEAFRDYDIRPHYDRLMSMRNKAVIARAPSLMIPELDGS